MLFSYWSMKACIYCVTGNSHAQTVNVTLLKECSQWNTYKQDCMYCANKSACYHTHLHPPTHTYCSHNTTDMHTHGSWRASPDRMLARMPSLFESKSQPSSTAVRFPFSPINGTQQLCITTSILSMVCFFTVKKKSLHSSGSFTGLSKHSVFLLNFLLLCFVYCPNVSAPTKKDCAVSTLLSFLFCLRLQVSFILSALFFGPST